MANSVSSASTTMRMTARRRSSACLGRNMVSVSLGRQGERYSRDGRHNSKNPSPRPPLRSGEGEQKGKGGVILPLPETRSRYLSPPLRFGEGAGGRGLLASSPGSHVLDDGYLPGLFGLVVPDPDGDLQRPDLQVRSRGRCRVVNAAAEVGETVADRGLGNGLDARQNLNLERDHISKHAILADEGGSLWPTAQGRPVDDGRRPRGVHPAAAGGAERQLGDIGRAVEVQEVRRQAGVWLAADLGVEAIIGRDLPAGAVDGGVLHH